MLVSRTKSGNAAFFHTVRAALAVRAAGQAPVICLLSGNTEENRLVTHLGCDARDHIGGMRASLSPFEQAHSLHPL